MRINGNMGPIVADEKRGAKATVKAEKPFEVHLAAKKEFHDTKEKLNTLRKEIEEQGDILKKKVDIREYKKYKSLVTVFLKETTASTFKFENEDTYDGKGRYRVLANVKVIDEKLQNLTEEFLKEQQDSLSVVKIIDDIRGMIVDLRL